MVISSRAIVAMGLCTVGLGLLVGPSPRPAARRRCPPDGQHIDRDPRGAGPAGDRHDRHGRRLQELREGQGLERGIQGRGHGQEERPA